MSFTFRVEIMSFKKNCGKGLCKQVKDVEFSLEMSLDQSLKTHVGETFTDGTILRAEAGPSAVGPPPLKAHFVQIILTLTVAIDTLGEYKWRHRGDFRIST